MIEPTNISSADRTRLIITGVCLFMTVLLISLALIDKGRPLKPVRTPATAVILPVNNQATFVTFPELNADPTAYLHQLIRVSGSYNPLPPLTCLPHNGPRIRWSLISDELQLDAIGFETILQEVSPGTILTVEGIWQRYHGPYGCGKQPPTNDAWYLEVLQIIEPNPLFSADIVALDTILGPSRTPVGDQPLPPTAVVEPNTPTIAPTETPLAPTLLPPTLAFTPTATTIVAATPTPTTAVIGTPNSTPAPGTATATPTPTMTPSPTPTILPTLTITVTATPTIEPGLPTLVVPTPDPYQGVTVTPAYP